MKTTLLILFAALACLAQPSIHLDSITNVMFGSSNNLPFIQVSFTITGLEPGQMFWLQKSPDLTNWVGELGLIATNQTMPVRSYNSTNMYPGGAFYRVMLPQ